MQDNFGSEGRPVRVNIFLGNRVRSVGFSRLFIAVFLIGAGTVLFLDNIGVLRVRNIWDFWPLILVAIGLSKFPNRSASERVLGSVLIVFGGLFLLLSLHVFAIHAWDGSWPLSLLLIAFGCVALVKAIESNQASRPRVGFPDQPTGPSANFLDECAILGSVKRRLDSSSFAGGRAQNFMGSIEVDLRYTQIASKEKTATIDVTCTFGSTKFRVPETWLVSIQAAAVLGNVEDKTIPARTMAGVEPATLIITGQSIFGSIEVEN